jgi:hypothetical protein
MDIHIPLPSGKSVLVKQCINKRLLYSYVATHYLL